MTLCVKFYTDAHQEKNHFNFYLSLSGGSQHKPTVPLTALTAALEEEQKA